MHHLNGTVWHMLRFSKNCFHVLRSECSLDVYSIEEHSFLLSAVTKGAWMRASVENHALRFMICGTCVFCDMYFRNIQV